MKKKIIIVLGMHRSGTSAIARGIIEMGAHPGVRLMPATDDNPKGYWEDLDILELNERILADLYFGWEDLDAIELDRFNTLLPLYEATYFENAVSIVKERFALSDTIIIKDPRMNLLLPFWKKVLADFPSEVRYILVARNPLETAKSLYKRNLMPINDGLALWFYYNFQSLRDLDREFLVVSFSHFLQEPSTELHRLADFVSLDISDEQLQSFQKECIDKTLKHHTEDLAALQKDAAEMTPILPLFESMCRWGRERFTTHHEAFNFIENILEDASIFLRDSSAPKDAVVDVQLFVDHAHGFSEENSFHWRTLKQDIQIHHQFNSESKIKRLRLDPGHRPCFVRFNNITLRNGEQNVTYNIIDGNHTFVRDNSYFFDVYDPHLSIQADTAELSQLDIGMKVLPLDGKFSSVRLFFKNKQVLEKNCLLSAKDTQLQEKDTQLQEKDTQLQEKDTQLQEKDTQLQEKDTQLAALQKTLQQEITSLLYNERSKNIRLFWLLSPLRFLRAVIEFLKHPQVSSRYLYEKWLIMYSGLFDKEYYLEQNRDLILWTDLLQHFIAHGWKEGRNPSETFNTEYYLQKYADVKRAGVNPLRHYIAHGRKEGRSPVIKSILPSPGIHFGSCYQQASNDLPPSKPFISIIVPNYNHARFLRQRLDSIYKQTYQHFEVILLDDCSQDNSREILEEYAANYSENTRILFNEKNSGSAFFQWEQGISAASGDLIWIAESDDWCSENFLDELVRYFDDDAVMLAYCRTVFMEAETNEQIWSIEEYLSDIDPERWNSPFVSTAHQIMNSAWAIKNIVPNVSSAVFRNPGPMMELLHEDSWKQMHICGDWMFYIHIIRGGLVAYTPSATNYYRFHQNNTSVATYAKDIYYQEHELVAQSINQLYEVPEELFHRQKRSIKQHWLKTRDRFSAEALERCYSVERIRLTREQRKPNLLMASYAFAAGGGEVLPIHMANLFKAAGYAVTFLNCDREERVDGVRKMLRQDIPVVTNFQELNSLLVNMNIDIIHSHHAWVDNSIIDIIDPNLEYQHVVSLHGMYEMISETEQDLEGILVRLLSKTSKLVYTADKNLQAFKHCGLFDEKHFVKIGNTLQNSLPIHPADLQQMGIPETAFVLCLVSRAIPEKGWQEAIETVQEARKLSGKDIHLLLIGEGQEYERLKSCSPDNIHFLGFKKNIRDFYAAAHLGYLPTRFPGESFPLVVIDCLFAGRPVLATELAEIPAMLSCDGDIAGSLFALEDGAIPIRSVAQIIASYASDENFYRERLGFVEKVTKKFSPDIVLDQYDAIYMDLFRSRSQTAIDRRGKRELGS